MEEEIKHSIKADVKDFFLILNCSYVTVTSLLSFLLENKTVALTAFSFCLINCIISVIFYRLRIMRYRRTENPDGSE